MLTESTRRAVRHSALVEAEELQQRTIVWISIGLAVLGFLVTWLGPAKHLTGRFLIYLSLLIEGIVAAYACLRRPFLARAVLLVGPTLSLGRAIVLLDSPLLPALAVLIVLANAAISMRSGVLSAILNTVMLCALAPFDTSLVSALALVWMGIAIQWLSFSGMRTALDWLWHSQEQVQELIDELRDRQGVLNRTLRSLDEANARMVAANERMAEARRQADEARQAKARFAANVSHELRTPLNIIVGFTEVMYNTPQAYQGVELSPDFLVDLGAVCRNAQHLQALVDDVLDLSQLDLDKFALQSVETDIADVVQEAVDVVRSMAKVRGLGLVAQIAPDLSRVRIDRTRIKQVLLNLLSNAIRYTEKGVVTVRVTSDDRYVLCSVTDTGPGIPEQEQLRIFQEFERLSPGQESDAKGTGLGLAISRRFVQEHGGRIWVESETGMGTTFSFTIPVLDEERYPTAMPTQVPSIRDDLPSTQQPLLIVTRSMIASRIFARHLSSYHCVFAADPQQAIRQIDDLQPLGLLVDAALGEDCTDLLTKGLQQKAISNIPLVVCSMPMQSNLPQQARIRAYLSKPVTRRLLQETLRAEGEDVEAILVVDDDADVLRLLTHYLQSDPVRPYVVWTARNGREALEIMGRERIDLVLLDLAMPVMDGYQLIHEMTRIPALASTPVIVFSGQDAVDPVSQVEGQMRLWMPEPIGAEKLIQATVALLRTVGSLGRPRR